MKEIGTIIDFTDEGKAIIEFESRGGGCAGCAARGMCQTDGAKRRMVLEVIPGVARNTRVFVDVGPRSLLKMPALAYLMVGSFLAGAIAAQLILRLFGADTMDLLSVLVGLVATAGTIIAISVKETRDKKEEFSPRIVGIVWRNH